MVLSSKNKKNIDWEYNISGNGLIQNNPVKKRARIKNRLDNSNLYIDFSGFKARSINKKKVIDNSLNKIFKSEKKNNFIQKKSYAPIYYGILFFLFFGFMFFLTISIGFASSGKNQEYNEENFYDNEKSVELLEGYILTSQKEETDDGILRQADVENSITKKIAYTSYRALKNDTIEKIARKFGLWNDTLLLVNNFKSDKHLKTGSIVLIPNQNGRIITVQNNDSIFKIADRYGATWQKIVDANDLKTSSISSGAKIFVPGSRMTSFEKDQFYTQKFIWPVKNGISSYFGPRIDPFTGTWGFHPGLDLKASMGEKIKNTKDGKVLFTGWEKVYGNFIIMKYSGNCVIIYGHLSKILVEKGQKVSQGDIIGLVGTTGRSTGPHLHFEVRKNDKLIDPLTILK